MTLAALFFAPQAALAINECDPTGVDPSANGNTADTFTCDPNDDFSLTGITYTSDGNLTLETPNIGGSRGPNLDVGDVGINATAGNAADNLFWDSSLFSTRRDGTILGTDGPVIDYRSVDGDIDIHVGGAIKGQQDATHAIFAEAIGAGGVSVTVEGNVNGGPGATGTGIEALTAAGDILIQAPLGRRDALLGGMGAEAAIRAVSSAGGDITINASGVNANRFRANGDGIEALTTSGDIAIETSEFFMSAGTGGQHAIHAAASAGGNVDITAGASVETGNDATHGILAETTSGNIVIGGNEFSDFQLGAVVRMGNSATHGIEARSTSGDIALNLRSVDGVVSGTRGILAESDSGDITIAGGDFGGSIAYPGDAVAIETRTGGVATLNGLSITRDAPSADAGFAIRSSGNRAVVNLPASEGFDPEDVEFPIDGFSRSLAGIKGAVDFSGLSGGAEVNIGAGNMWALGADRDFSSPVVSPTTSRFSDAADVVNIETHGFLYTPLEVPSPQTADGSLDEDRATVDFGGGDDVVNHAGELLVGPRNREDYEAELRLENLETFNHAGTIRLGAAYAGGNTDELRAGTDGRADDILVLTGGTTFHGEGGRVLMDVRVDAVGQTACDTALRDADGDLPVADCVSIPNGAATGRTSVLVNDQAPFSRGAFNPEGNVIVDLSGGDPDATDPEAFVIDPASENFNPANGTIDKGLFQYVLAYDPALQQFRLYGLPGSAGLEFPLLAHASNDLWHTVTDGWFERRADQRDVDLDAGLGGGVWVRGGYKDADRDVITPVATGGGLSFEFDNTYTQTDKTLTFGLDMVSRSAGDSAWVVGAMIGYGRAELEYEEQVNSANLEGAHAGFYGSFVTGPFYVDAALNAAKFDIKNDVPTLGLVPEGTFLESEARAVGAQVETGWRLRFGWLAVEPLAGLNYVQTSIDNIGIPKRDPVFFGGEAEFEDTISNRASAGVRLSAENIVPDPLPIPFTGASVPMPVIDLGLTARGIEELDGESDVSIANEGPIDAPVSDEYGDTFGRATFDVSVTNTAKTVAGYLQVDGTFGDDYDSVSGSLGFRYQW